MARIYSGCQRRKSKIIDFCFNINPWFSTSCFLFLKVELLAFWYFQELGVPWVTLLSMDSFYKVLTHDQHELAANNEYNFDHPDAFDFDLVKNVLLRV